MTGGVNVTRMPLAYVQVALSALRTPLSVSGGRQPVAMAAVVFQQLPPANQAQVSVVLASLPGVASSPSVASLPVPASWFEPLLEQAPSAHAKIIRKWQIGRRMVA